MVKINRLTLKNHLNILYNDYREVLLHSGVKRIIRLKCYNSHHPYESFHQFYVHLQHYHSQKNIYVDIIYVIIIIIQHLNNKEHFKICYFPFIPAANAYNVFIK